MKLKELINYTSYDIPVIEFYNEFGEMEYSIDLDSFSFDDIDVVYGRYFEPYGILKLKRDNGQTKPNDKNIQPPESKL
jgi:hypothetical protein